jgi:nitrogen regulatory protein P-II 1
MKSIEAIIRRIKLNDVKIALQQIGIEDFMESTVVCHGRDKGKLIYCRGTEYVVRVAEKVKLDIIAADELVAKIVEAVGSMARTDRKEDCRIIIHSVC